MKNIMLALMLTFCSVALASAYEQTITIEDTNQFEDGYHVEVRDAMNVWQPAGDIVSPAVSMTYECTLATCCYRAQAYGVDLADSAYTGAMCQDVPVLVPPINMVITN